MGRFPTAAVLVPKQWWQLLLLLLLSLAPWGTTTSSARRVPGIVAGFATTPPPPPPPPTKRGGRKIATTTNAQPPRRKRGSKQPRTAVVVGGGPGGLATALVLSRIRSPGGSSGDDDADDADGFYFDAVLVLDEAPEESYDPARSYFFNVNGRGQRFIDAFGIDLAGRGTAVTSFDFHYVPGDPGEVFDGTEKPVSQPMSDQERENVGTLYWIPRHELVQLLIDEINTKHGRKRTSKTGATIEFRRGLRCKHVEPSGDGLVKIVAVESGSGGTETVVVADVCVGADGISSNVRQSLEDGRFDPEHWLNANNPSKKFGLKSWVSPSTGLRFKGLRIDSKFAIPKGGANHTATTTTTNNNNNDDDEGFVPIDPGSTYAMKSVTNGPTNRFSFGILPQKNPESIASRPINICTEPNHDIWDDTKIRTDDGGVSARAFFEKAHPRYDWGKLVKPEEWETFSKTVGLSFPPCSYVPSMYVCSNGSKTKDGTKDETETEAGVVLVGDALHSFPPDTGQGVNAAFCDAMALGKSFEKAAASEAGASGSFVATALADYQASQGPESRALVELVRCGAPFQYRQSSVINRFRKLLWTANIVLRIGLNKATLGWSPKPAVIMCMDPNMSFLQVMRKANTLTAVLWSSLLMVVISLVKKLVSH